jgi:hypothetical protein
MNGITKHKRETKNKSRREGKTEIKKAIKDQLTYIKNSCDLFDNGFTEEAIRISAAINVLMEDRKRSKGLLYRIKRKFKLISTAPDCDKPNTDRLIINTCRKVADVPNKLTNENEIAIKNKNKILLTFVTSEKRWHIYTYKHHKKIYCYIDELEKALGLKRQKLLLLGWIRKYQTSKNTIKPIGKEIILIQLNSVLEHKFKYPDHLYYPLIEGTIFNPTPRFNHAKIKNIDIENWKNEIIFATSDEKRALHTLTRWDLIKAARDQDGGGHYDLKLDSIYQHSKYGQTVIKHEDKEITTENFHLIMLRQLGHELLECKDIQDYVK